MRMKPWMLANVLALFEAAQAGYVPGLSVEAYLLRVAKTDSKPILEFEGIEQQFELFEKAPWATQISFLEEALKAVESRGARRELNRIVQAWERRPWVLERLLAEMRASAVGGSRFTSHCNCSSAIRRWAQDRDDDGRGTYVFASGLCIVGAARLVELLRGRGFTLTDWDGGPGA